jgi:hypothetical protein
LSEAVLMPGHLRLYEIGPGGQASSLELPPVRWAVGGPCQSNT